jgi:hypothetical protein
MVHSEVTNQISDHLPTWAKFLRLDELAYVPKRNSIDERLICDHNMHNKKNLRFTTLNCRLV